MRLGFNMRKALISKKYIFKTDGQRALDSSRIQGPSFHTCLSRSIPDRIRSCRERHESIWANCSCHRIRHSRHHGYCRIRHSRHHGHSHSCRGSTVHHCIPASIPGGSLRGRNSCRRIRCYYNVHNCRCIRYSSHCIHCSSDYYIQTNT